MSKVKISEFSSTPGNNTDIDGINLAEGCAPSGINDAIRELMAQLKDFQTGAVGDSFNGPVGTTTAAAGAFTTLSATGVTTVQAGSAGAPAITTSGDTNTGIFFPAADTIAFSEGGVETARFDSAGNLGLGVTPSAWASVKAIQYINGAAWGIGTTDSGLSQNAYFNSGWKYISSSAAATLYAMSSGAHAWSIAPSGTAGNAITFTQAMTLDASGNLLVGTTSGSGARIQAIQNGTNDIFQAEVGTSGTTLRVVGTGSSVGVGYFTTSSGLAGQINCSGTSTTYSTSSDYRLKNITGPITTSGAYIDSLNPVEGTWKADGSTFVGLIAHEVQEASRTNVATGVKDGEQMQGMDYSSAEIIANLIAEVKSLRARLAAAGI
jgi:hypothetical protein